MCPQKSLLRTKNGASSGRYLGLYWHIIRIFR